MLSFLCISTTVQAYDAEIDGIYYNFISETEAEVTFLEGDGVYMVYASNYAGHVVIPESVTYNGKKFSVTRIGDLAFAYSKDLTAVTIPASITSIGYDTFSFCGNLSAIKVDEGNACFDSRDGCNAIIVKETNGLFVGCNKTVIPDGVEGIYSYAFVGCKGLTSITIPSSVKAIGNYPFVECYFARDSLINNSSVEEWNPGAIICDKETKEGLLITNNEIVLCRPWATAPIIPDDVTSIGSNAFKNCSGMTSITIGSGLTSIDYGAFEGCYGLKAVHVSDMAAWCNVSFYDNGDYAVQRYWRGNPIPSQPLYYAHHLYLNGQEVKDLVIPRRGDND